MDSQVGPRLVLRCIGKHLRVGVSVRPVFKYGGGLQKTPTPLWIAPAPKFSPGEVFCKTFWTPLGLKGCSSLRGGILWLSDPF